MTTTAIRKTFAVSDVVPSNEPLPDQPYIQAVSEFLICPIESCSRYHGKLIADVRSHPLIGALDAAFGAHYPLTLSPDIIWLTICQGFAHHVNMHAETLRQRLVKHEGKIQLVVERDDFVKGSPENPWAGVFAEFSKAIRVHIGDTHDLIVADFSTTGPVERAASEVVLMDTMQAFFSYEVQTLCGIPAINLEGTADDWRKIAQRVSEFRRFNLDWWIDALHPVLDEFVAASEGKVNRRFWDSIYKWHGPQGSGSPYVSGWVLKFFPYLDNPEAKFGRRFGEANTAGPYTPNRWLSGPPSKGGPGRDDFPSLPAKTPFVWNYFGTKYEMEFVGGLIGIAQDPDTLCLRPEIGWAVLDKQKVNQRRVEEAEAERAEEEARKARIEQIRAEALETMKAKVFAPHIDPCKPRFEQFFRIVCPFCKYAEEIGLWNTCKICAGCKKMSLIIRKS